ncbi:hypothetical protein SAMN05421743_10439 [Thalassobacillus cyri]|uniref:Uncharacterized protein n=1 Tax=Thalassobacillus cyri TaxID=571932 RepID=A0A1H4ABR5_9BACI|nr:hypothetical protein SAMN05421743_10439 [Thalassobacillus cyri]
MEGEIRSCFGAGAVSQYCFVNWIISESGELLPDGEIY